MRLGEHNTDTTVDCINDGFEEICQEDPPLDISVEKAIAHERYDPLDTNQYHDIALLRLSKSVKFSSE